MPNEELSIDPLAVPIPELVRQCDELLSRGRQVAPTAARINQLRDRREEISRKLMSPNEASENYAALQRQEANLQEQVDELCEPFNETREAVRAFLERLRYSLRFVEPEPDLLPIRDELEHLAAPYIAASKSFVSLRGALRDLSVIRARLPRLADAWPQKEESRTGTATDQEPQAAKPPKIKRRGRRPISEKDQRKLAKVLSPEMEEDRWMIPGNLEKICKRLDTRKVAGPADRSWTRTFEDDQSNRTRKVIATIRYRLYSARLPAKNYLDS